MNGSPIKWELLKEKWRHQSIKEQDIPLLPDFQPLLVFTIQVSPEKQINKGLKNGFKWVEVAQLEACLHLN